MMEFNYPACREKVHTSIRALEDEWNLTKPAIEAAYASLRGKDETAARQILTDYTCRQAQKAWDWAVDTKLELENARHADRMNFWRSKL